MTPVALRVLEDSIEVLMEIISRTHGGGGMLEATRNHRLSGDTAVSSDSEVCIYRGFHEQVATWVTCLSEAPVYCE